MEKIKAVDTVLTEDFLKGLIGKTVHAPTNKLTDREGHEHNVWFAGLVAGYQKTTTKFDFINSAFLDESTEQFHLLLTDGMAYTLSTEELEINELTEEEFMDMVAEYTAKQIAEDKLILPEKKDKIILPGKDF